MEEEVVLVIPENHDLAIKPMIDLREVASESFIALAGYDEYKNTVNKLYQNAGFDPKVIFEVDYDLLIEMFQLHKCVGLIPITLCKKSNLHFIRISDLEAKFVVGLSWLKGKTLSPFAQDFMDFIISYYPQN